MTFIESIQTCFRKYASFDGTARRSEYWWFFLFNVIAGSILGQVGTVPSVIFTLAMLLPSLAVATRRLHDTDRSGWWQLICFVPLIGWIVLIVFLAQEGKANRYGAAPAYAA
jgi:uncharacterized membrane protein YhaH (DUF805 family)